ncbi:MAG: glycosyltransferase family 2 protein [Pseudomonadota bacterium]
MSAPDYSVVIPHYNDVSRLTRCLEALMPQATEDVEVIVADNNSTDSLDPIRARWPGVIIAVETEKGAGPARNKGVEAARGKWLMFIDSDCLPADDWVARGKAAADEGAIIGGPVGVFHETPAPCSGAEAFETVFAFKMKRYLEEEAFLGAGNLVLAKSAFEKTGGFRAAVAEDKEWSRRAARTGFRLGFADDFVCSHPSRRDWPALRHKWRRLASEDFLLWGKEARLRYALRALLLPPSAVAHTPRVLRHPDLSSGEKLRAVFTLFRQRLFRTGVMLGQAVTGRA